MKFSLLSKNVRKMCNAPTLAIAVYCCLVTVPGASAKTLALAVPESPDRATNAFLTTLIQSERLRTANIEVLPVGILSLGGLREVVPLLLSGKIALGLIPLSAIQAGRSVANFTYTALVSQPLIVSSVEEQFALQDSIYGDIVASEIGRTGLVSLAFWNRGQTQILTWHRIERVTDFRGMKIATQSRGTETTFAALGAQTSTTSSGQSAPSVLLKRLFDAVELTPDLRETGGFGSLKGGTAVTNFRSIVGILASGVETWRNWSERERRAIQQAAKDAEVGSRDVIIQIAEQNRAEAQESGIRTISFHALENLAATRETARKAWLENAGAAGAHALKLLDQVRTGEGRETPPENRHREDRRGDVSPPLFFATDRNDEGDPDLLFRFGIRLTAPPTITCGKVHFDHSAQRSIGELYEGPIRLADGTPIYKSEACVEAISSDADNWGGHVVVLVHGYWNSFESALRRAIAVTNDLRIRAVSVIWSWPSMDQRSGYFYDEESVDWSEWQFEDFLETLSNNPKISSIDLIGHSMGGRLVLRALFALADHPEKLRNLVFVAPDVRIDIFRNSLEQFPTVGRIRTLYASERDRALQLSEWIHRSPRAGTGGDQLLLMEGLESIDASRVESFWGLNHYHAYEVPEAVADLKVLVTQFKPAAKRGLTSAQRQGLLFWFIEPDRAD